MSGPFGSQQWMYASGGFYSHPIDQSLRFNDDDSAYLSRTPASAGNRKTWTWSGWVKRGNLGSNQNIFASNGTDNTTYLDIRFNSSDQLQVGNYTALILVTTQVFRDPSAWYHVVWLLDTTQATASNRSRLFVNGVEITSFSTDARSSYFAQNTDYGINNSALHEIARNPADSAKHFDGYMAEVNFVDGQALDASSFGENKSGVWIPKSYSGSYGTNGFYLDFGNSGSLGADSSGNGNNWTPTNLAATDQVIDSPTNNFFTLSPINALASGFALSEGNTKVSGSNASRPRAKAGSAIPTSGSWYWEILVNTQNNNQLCLGITSSPVSVGAFPDQTGDHGFRDLEAGWNAGDIVSFRLNSSDFLLSYSVNGGSWTTASRFGTPSTTLPNFVLVQIDGSSTETVTLNFGQDSSFAGQKTAQGNTDANGIGDFYYSPPSGYLALCSANLPDPVAAIDPALDANPEDHFNTVLYTGNGTSQAITGVGFQPDLVWLKSRSVAANHGLHDVLRVVSGAQEILYSNLTNAGNTGGGYLSSIDSDGFTVNNNTSGNGSGYTFAAWNWKAGGTGVSNTDGTITSTVSANVDAGFSIVSYTGNGTQTTTGHGLSAKPDIVIQKRRNAADNWYVFTDLIDGSFDYLILNSTNAKGDATGYATQTASVMATPNWSDAVIAYCFHSVEGFSKFGSYTGNGSTDGPFVYTGFRPAFVIMKRTDSTSNWEMVDNQRDPINHVYRDLSANSSNAENAVDGTSLDFLSNGFKHRDGTSTGTKNVSGATYIFMAFAEMPFKYANAR